MKLVKLKTEEGIVFFNPLQITQIRAYGDSCTIWFSDNTGIDTTLPVSEILKRIQEAENGR